MTAHPVGRGWSAMVEVSAPADAEPRVVPFSAMLPSEKEAQAAGRVAAVRWLDRAAKERPA